ncbi:hypothetical protein M5D96_009668, partial [Drosophila gunungcola]
MCRNSCVTQSTNPSRLLRVCRGFSECYRNCIRSSRRIFPARNRCRCPIYYNCGLLLILWIKCIGEIFICLQKNYESELGLISLLIKQFSFCVDRKQTTETKNAISECCKAHRFKK